MRTPAALLLIATLSGCGSDPATPAPSELLCPTAPHQRLSEYGYFEGNGATQRPRGGVVPYEVIAPLYSDETAKHRFITLAPGARIHYAPTERWELPVGTTLIKTFAYPRSPTDPTAGERLLETRLLIRTADAWTVHTYVWNDAQTEATCTVAGPRVPFAWRDAQGRAHDSYRVPNNNQCYRCHGQPGATAPIGPRTRQLDRTYDYGSGAENQLDHMAALGMFDAPLPPAADRARLVDYRDTTLSIEQRARSYLEANCAHCHNPRADARFSGLYLNLESTAPTDLGVCRRPFSPGGTGGSTYDIVPGRPEQSVLIYRVRSEDPLIKMPELPTQTSDPLGVELLTGWVAGMSGQNCGE